MNIPISNVIWLLFLTDIIRNYQVSCWLHTCMIWSELSIALLGEAPVRPPPLWASLSCLNWQVVCFQISLCVGSVINITCLHHCSLISSSPLLENCGDICLIPISWDLSYYCFFSADFQSPWMHFFWAWNIELLLLLHLYWNSVLSILLIPVGKVFFLDKDESQI